MQPTQKEIPRPWAQFEVITVSVGDVVVMDPVVVGMHPGPVAHPDAVGPAAGHLAFGNFDHVAIIHRQAVAVRAAARRRSRRSPTGC